MEQEKTFVRSSIVMLGIAIVGFLGNTVFLIIRITVFGEVYLNFLMCGLVVITSIVCIVTKKVRLKVLHPLVVSLATIILLIVNPTHYYTFSSFFIVFAFLFRYDFLTNKFLQKTCFLLGAFVLFLAISLAFTHEPVLSLIGPLIYCVGHSILSYAIFKDRLTPYLKPPIVLKSLDLNEKSQSIVKAFAAGSSPKKIALDEGCSEKTVYRALTAICKKLKIDDYYELVRHLANRRIE